MANELTRLVELQREYFDILEASELVQACKAVDSDHVSIPGNLLNRKRQLVLPSDGQWKPRSLVLVERLFDAVYEFWSSYSRETWDCLRELEGHYVHVDDTQIEVHARKYGVLMDGLLVSDQLMMQRRDYLAADSVPAWENLLVEIIGTVYHYLGNRELFLPERGQPVAIVVPAQLCLQPEVETGLHYSSDRLALRFFAGLLDRSFTDVGEYLEFFRSRDVPESELDPELREKVYTKYRASNLRDYLRGLVKVLAEQQGVDWWKEDRVYQLMWLDVSTRIEEFERFACDGYDWNQESEIPLWDGPLYEWWFGETAREAGRALGASYTVPHLCKLAVQCEALSFLEDVPVDELMQFRETDPARSLREDLALQRIGLRRSRGSPLDAEVDAVGEYIQKRMQEFAEEVEELRNAGWVGVASRAGKTLVTGVGMAGLQRLAAEYPSLSYLTLIWGSTLGDTWEAEKTRQSELRSKIARPIATLIAWRDRAEE